MVQGRLVERLEQEWIERDRVVTVLSLLLTLTHPQALRLQSETVIRYG